MKLKWSTNWVLVNKATRAAAGAVVQINKPTAATLSVTDCKLYVPVSSVKWGHLGHFDPTPTNIIFPTNPMGSSGTL